MKSKWVFWVSLVLLVFLLNMALAGEEEKADKQEKTPWTPEDIVRMESAGQWDISPDGKRAVWVKSQMDKEKNGRVSNLFLADLETKKEVQLTRGTENHSQPRWSPDGGWIAFLSTRPLPKPKSELARSQLWLIDPSGGEPYHVTELERGIRSFKWIDDETIIFSAQEDPALYEEENKKVKDDTKVVDDVAHEPPVRLFQLKIKDKKINRLTDNTDFISAWDVTSDGKMAATVHQQYLSFVWDHKILPKTFFYDLTTGERKEVFVGERIPPFGVRWTRDKSGFYAVAPYSTHPKFFTASIMVLYFYDVASGKHLQVDLDWENGLGFDFEVTPDGFLTLLPDGARFQPARYVKKGLTWTRTNLEGEHVRNIFGLAASEDARRIVYSYSTASTPEQWYSAILEGGRLTGEAQITNLNSDLKNRTFARTELIKWKGALGEEIEGLLYYPHNYEAGKKYPLFTAPHGGPAGADLDAWDESYAYPHQLINQRGAFILKPNYHGSSNYGLKFVESICCGKYYELPVEDIEKGVDLLIAKGLVDAEKIGSFGWSNGSILSIALSIANPDRYKVLGAGAGDVEWISDWANVDFGQSFDSYYFGASPLEDPELYVRLSPLFQMDKVKAPTIIFFGTEDRNVPTSQGWTHYRALYHLDKVPVKFLLFPGEPHGLRKYAHQLRKIEEEMAWFDRHFFKTEKAENEAFKKDSPLGQALRRRSVAKVGTLYGVTWKGAGEVATEILIPEVVKRGGLEIGRFEVTRAQFASFEKGYPVTLGTENYPANNISFEKAKGYADWLSKLTGELWRIPNEDEVVTLYEGPGGENTLDYWAGYSPNPDDARRLEAKVRELGEGAPLLKEVGSFGGVGKDEEELLFDLGGNVAEWVIGKDGTGKRMGLSADLPSDSKARTLEPRAEYTGFRVVRGEAKTKGSQEEITNQGDAILLSKIRQRPAGR